MSLHSTIKLDYDNGELVINDFKLKEYEDFLRWSAKNSKNIKGITLSPYEFFHGPSTAPADFSIDATQMKNIYDSCFKCVVCQYPFVRPNMLNTCHHVYCFECTKNFNNNK